MVKITLPDGKGEEFKKGVTGLEIAKKIGERLAMAALAIEVNGKVQDLSTPIEQDSKIKIFTFKDKEGIEVFRHSSAHLLAQAVTELFPEAKLTIGPVVEEGFYYDIDHTPFRPEDVEKIEKKMKEIVDRKLVIERVELSKKDALKQFKDNKYKIEIINEMTDKEVISAYKQGDFIDLCRGPHVLNTSVLKAFKITKIAAAYWRADAKNKQLQRIYGISFPEKKDMDTYLKTMEEAEKRDHRKLGRELDLFMVHDFALHGNPFFLPKGAVIYNELQKFIREEYFKRGYLEVITPQIFKKALWETSGHWQHYKDNMFNFKIGDQEYSLKPMNCPSHLLIYKSKVRSYRELPLRIADFGVLHRNELPGVVGGLTRVVKMSQDDGHIFVAPDQIENEIIEVLNFIKHFYSDIFKFNFKLKLSTRPAESMGEKALWDQAEKDLASALKRTGMQYEVKEGEGAFYGPKIDIDVKDSLNRDWQLATIQLDFQLPRKFEATYETPDGKRDYVVMIHRAIFGSIERFIGVLIEHYAGKFPLWLSPVQVKILPIADRHIEYAEKVYNTLHKAGIRVEVDKRAESTPKKVRDAELDRVNYILVVGDKEQSNGTVNVRTRDNVVHGEKRADILLNELLDEIKNKK